MEFIHNKTVEEFNAILDPLVNADNLDEISFQKVQKDGREYQPTLDKNPGFFRSIQIGLQNFFGNRKQNVILDIINFIKANPEHACKNAAKIKQLGLNLSSLLEGKKRGEVQREFNNYERSITTLNREIGVRNDDAAAIVQKALSDADKIREEARSKAVDTMKGADSYHKDKVAESAARELRNVRKESGAVKELDQRMAEIQQKAQTVGLDLKISCGGGKQTFANSAELAREIPFFQGLRNFETQKIATRADVGRVGGLEEGLQQETPGSNTVDLSNFSEATVRRLLDFVEDSASLKAETKTTLKRVVRELDKSLESLEDVSQKMIKNLSVLWKDLDEVDLADRRKAIEKSFSDKLDQAQAPLRELLAELKSAMENVEKPSLESLKEIMLKFKESFAKIPSNAESALKELETDFAGLLKDKSIDLKTSESLKKQIGEIREELLDASKLGSSLKSIGGTNLLRHLDRHFEDVLELSALSDYLGYENLSETLASFMEKNLTDPSKLIEAMNHVPFEKENQLCKFLCDNSKKHFSDLIKNAKFVEIPSEYLLDIIKDENLGVAEGGICDAVIKWAKAQAVKENVEVQEILSKSINGESLLDQIRFENISKAQFSKIENLLPQAVRDKWKPIFDKTAQLEAPKAYRMPNVLLRKKGSISELDIRIPRDKLLKFLENPQLHNSVIVNDFPFNGDKVKISLGRWSVHSDRIYIAISYPKDFKYKIHMGDQIIETPLNVDNPDSVIATYGQLTGGKKESAVYYTSDQLRSNLDVQGNLAMKIEVS
ncbi:MAG: hypothetical protein H0W88_08340 [Parachlamydiaceae bacterium]|nr:hypothetical protein [Parachlamydiaceae bacterium]